MLPLMVFQTMLAAVVVAAAAAVVVTNIHLMHSVFCYHFS
jgi:hypothetical protein